MKHKLKKLLSLLALYRVHRNGRVAANNESFEDVVFNDHSQGQNLTGFVIVHETDDPTDTDHRWQPHGQITDLNIGGSVERETLFREYGGKKISVGEKFGALSQEITFNIKELTKDNLALLTFGDLSKTITTPNNAQAALTAAAGATLNFDEGTAGNKGIKRGQSVDIKTATGAVVEQIVSIVLTGANAVYGAGASSTTLALGVDYVINRDKDGVTFLRDINDDNITVSGLTASAITAADKTYLETFEAGIKAPKKGWWKIFGHDGCKPHVRLRNKIFGTGAMNGGAGFGTGTNTAFAYKIMPWGGDGYNQVSVPTNF